MKIGSYDVHLIETGDFRLDGGAMFGVVPKVLWNRTNPTDGQNRIEMVMRGILIEGNGHKILVDAGAGDKEGEKFVDLYAVDYSRNSLLRSLASHSLKPEDITDVIYTHLHFDHAGGTTRFDGNHVVPTFPNARHYVQRRHWDHAVKPSERDRASFLLHNYVPIQDAGLLEFIDGDTVLFPGVELIVHNGHTPGMQSVRISDGNSTVWFPADLLPTSSHIPLPYIMGYDLYPVTTLEEKKKILVRAFEENWVLVFEHDPFFPACRLAKSERGHILRGESVTIE